ncbi:MAG: glutathione S-transferase family protein [bacterium]|nr:glutathione S-transferase family protein [Gammaproteobacteria bacterium]HIL98050.1 glutathione S-transferase family protein [Pseudomonadales bacterium]
MSEFILHHYPASPFSEKVRLLMAYKKQACRSVIIPVIMPKPGLMPLTGGYRKTPVAQIGADIYCDTAIICRLIDRMFPDNSIYPAEFEASLGAMAHWTDTFFFMVSVGMVFQPEVMQNHELFSDPEVAAAFVADRAELRKGSKDAPMEPGVVKPYWLMHMKRLDEQLANHSFMFGDQPSIVDFSTYHCCWFVYNNEVLRDGFKPFENVLAWRERMSAFGEGDLIEMSALDALEVAKNVEPVTQPKIAAMGSDGLASGDTVEIMPIDYGLQPTSGELLVASLEELALLREDPQVGKVAVHFPRLGFQVNKIA